MTQPPLPFFQDIHHRLDDLRGKDLWRRRRLLAGQQGPVVEVDGRKALNFCSNDYLGLAAHPKLKQALAEGAERYGVGSGASQLVCGYSAAHRQLEERICEHTGRDRALLFSSGFLANQAIITTLPGRDDNLFGDRLNHASLIDAALLSRARFRRYAHADVTALAKMLSAVTAGNKMVVTDAVFSMDGDLAPLVEIAKLCREQQALLIVDDAHGYGVLGNSGGGTLEHYALEPSQVPMLMATFGKALGVAGAFIAGDRVLIEYLLQAARSLIYTTAPSPAQACAIMAAYDLLDAEKWRQQALQQRVEQFRQGAKERELPVMESATPIQPLLVHDTARAVAISEFLFRQGIWLTAIRPPTVPQGTSRLRITLTAAHTDDHVNRLLDCLAEVKWGG